MENLNYLFWGQIFSELILKNIEVKLLCGAYFLKFEKFGYI